MGAQSWQLNILHFSILTSLIGQDGFMGLYRDKDPAVGEGDGVVESFRILRALSELADEGAANRAWNDTLNLMAEGKAGIYVMGSWAGGELASMARSMAPNGLRHRGRRYLDRGRHGLHDPRPRARVQGQDDFIRALLDPAVQTAFSVDKGSIPSRTDADTAGLSECSQMVAQGMAEDRGVPNVGALLSGDAQGQIGDLLMNFWADPSVTPEDAAAQYAQIVLNDF